MSKYRIINDAPGSFQVQRKTWLGWGTIFGRYVHVTEKQAETYIDMKLNDELWVPKPPREYP